MAKNKNNKAPQKNKLNAEFSQELDQNNNNANLATNQASKQNQSRKFNK